MASSSQQAPTGHQTTAANLSNGNNSTAQTNIAELKRKEEEALAQLRAMRLENLKRKADLKKENTRREQEAFEAFMKMHDANLAMEKKQPSMSASSSKAEVSQKKPDQANTQKNPGAQLAKTAQPSTQEKPKETNKSPKEIANDEWVAERKRKALLNDPETVRRRERYMRELEQALKSHKPHDGCCCGCAYNRFKFSLFSRVVTWGEDLKVKLVRD